MSNHETGKIHRKVEEVLPFPETNLEVRQLSSAAMSDVMKLRARGIVFGNAENLKRSKR